MLLYHHIVRLGTLPESLRKLRTAFGHLYELVPRLKANSDGPNGMDLLVALPTTLRTAAFCSAVTVLPMTFAYAAKTYHVSCKVCNAHLACSCCNPVISTDVPRA